MKIGVCIKEVADTASKIELRADGTGINESSLKFVMNPYDEFALEEALLVKDKDPQTEVVVISIGPERIGETIRKALAQSRNIPAIRALILAGGEERVLQTAHDMGVVSPLQTRDANRAGGWESFAYGYPLAIGSAETSLLELVTGYSTIADHGSFSPAVSINEIRSSSGSVLFTPRNQAPRQAVDARVADALTDILSDNSARPKKWAPAITLPPDFWAAWKTGTGNVCFLRSPYGNCWSYGINNTWTIGYTRKLVVGVWVGNADNTVMHPDADGLNSALPLWQDFVRRAQSVQ